MDEKNVQDGEEMSSDGSARRAFLRKSSGVAVAAPAVVLLLAAHSKVAEARIYGPD
jgi:hypothetical protein